MPMELTVMIVGAGRFGAHYPGILAELNAESRASSGTRRFDRLVLTRTDIASAERTAATIAEKSADAFDKITGAEVADAIQLKQVLDRFRPDLICITARDTRLGDAIHARYVPIALKYGNVFCEKPFSRAADTAALPLLDDLIHSTAPGRFGMHLPMAAVLQTMTTHERLGPLVGAARRIDFIWEKMGGSDDLIADLALHPWSLIPGREDLHVTEVTRNADTVAIDYRSKLCHGRMILRSGGSFRGMRLDDLVLRFEYGQGALRVIACAEAWSDFAAGKRVCDAGAEWVTVPNPLKQHLRAVIDGRPITGLSQTRHAQKFLAQTAQ